MQAAGFVVVGGRSSRMGRDKALLPYSGTVLAAHIARIVEAAAGSAVLIGDSTRYGSLGFPVWPDAVSNSGPLGGLITILRRSRADWNLVTACDMPHLEVSILRRLIERAQTLPHGAVCVAAETNKKLQPMCAVYHRDCLPLAEEALARGELRMMDLLTRLRAVPIECPQAGALSNVNTPEEWREAAGLL